MAKWQIGRSVASCQACESEFKEGDALYSLLRTGAEGLERADLCQACVQDDALDGALFWWRTHHHVEAQRGLKLDLEALEALFMALDPDPQADPKSDAEPQPDTEPSSGGQPGSQRLLELRYLLCLILLRKRRLKVSKVARKHRGVEGEFFLVRRPRRTEQLAVAVFDFDSERIGMLRDDLQRIFEGADPAELAATGSDADPERGPATPAGGSGSPDPE